MPGGDGTGPRGLGPMTGRAAGYCAGYPAPGYTNPIPGRGWGMGYGRGRGFGRGWGRGWGRGFGWGAYAAPYYGAPYTNPPYSATINPKQEMDLLRQEARALQEEIDAINSRVKELESNGSSAIGE